MIDLKFLRENPEVVKQNIRNKFQDQKLPLVDEVIELDAERRATQQQADDLKQKRNSISKQIGALMAQGKKAEAEEAKKEVAEFGDELAALANIQAILLDGQFIQNYGQLFETRYIENPANLWENYWLHVWKMYSRSPFAQCICYASGTNGPQSVAIDSVSLPTVKAGTAGNKTIDAEVTVTGLVPKGAQLVKWSVALSERATGEATIDATGKLTWTDDFTAADTITVTCTSAIDDTVYDSEVITVGAAT